MRLILSFFLSRHCLSCLSNKRLAKENRKEKAITFQEKVREKRKNNLKRKKETMFRVCGTNQKTKIKSLMWISHSDLIIRP